MVVSVMDISIDMLSRFGMFGGLVRFGMCGGWVLPMIGLEFLGVSNCWFEVSNGLLSRLVRLQLGVTITNGPRAVLCVSDSWVSHLTIGCLLCLPLGVSNCSVADGSLCRLSDHHDQR